MKVCRRAIEINPDGICCREMARILDRLEDLTTQFKYLQKELGFRQLECRDLTANNIQLEGDVDKLLATQKILVAALTYYVRIPDTTKLITTGEKAREALSQVKGE